MLFRGPPQLNPHQRNYFAEHLDGAVAVNYPFRDWSVKCTPEFCPNRRDISDVQEIVPEKQ
jgi:hypothetical protein